jgi:hypothetical protein
MTRTGTRIRVSDSFDLPFPRRDAFRLFTARGEELWVPGWQPEFLAETVDDLEPGTVWRTRDDAGRSTSWIVVASDPGVSARYARVAEGRSIGLVEVAATDVSDGCRITVAYDLTSDDPQGGADLEAFAVGYPEFLASWRAAILAYTAAGGQLPHAAAATSGAVA